MATGKERGARHAEFLAVAGQIERLRVTDPNDVADAQRAEELARWQHVFSREIDEAIERRDRSVGKITAASVSHDDLVAWTADAERVLAPVVSS